jgi:superfamily II DNA helicase RecQ
MAPDRHDDDLTRQDMVERLKLEAQHFVSSFDDPTSATPSSKNDPTPAAALHRERTRGRGRHRLPPVTQRVDEIASTLADHGPEGAGLPRWTRPFDSNGKTALREDGDVVMVATIAGMGIDKPTCALWRTWTSRRTSGPTRRQTAGVTDCRPTRWMVWPAGRGQPAPDD